ncbi:eEF1A lysine and N-terminal methyltransferase homolog [Diorhabda carinulata]|uniref:eEF1A lysine and N-terminal methyltransferase homolog n=1 Tax=Diorhabda carinulata TaxID=1163345 RepID=UPI0025A243A0|nr:eEF1A lysine and N-terminal methyltransferase homolog [Diorhabda carinulata]XP_057661193.1 eEF1A lysine and N-terminal methyltransferase homolog [Diorhabda carinulata]
MNLLPKSKEEFSQKDYWNEFFKKRGNEAFEWYGEYNELSLHLHKYIRKPDSVLIVGCGNSSLGKDLFDLGYRNITNIDISDVVIRQLLSQIGNRENLKYLQMDALNMTFDNEQFSVILDKGTLDALMPDDSEETIEKIKKYFDEISRVLKIGGRYICISLLQEHILQFLLKYFPLNNFMFRIVRCFEAEIKAADNGQNPIPVFIVVCTKFKTLTQKVLEINLGPTDKMQRCNSDNDVISQITNAQNAAFICSSLKRTSIADKNEVVFDLFEQGSVKPRFTVYVVDIPPQRNFSQYAAFIVPEGREVEWLFSTPNGRKKLVEVTKHNRLSIITLHRDQKYESFEAIQTELTDVVCNLAPSNLRNKMVAFLSLGSDVGHRIVRYKGHSDLSGDFVIEDVITENNEKYRRLFYMSSQLVIQSEAKLRIIKSRKGIMKETVDLVHLTCRHHVYMSIATYLACNNKTKANVTVIGLGGGGLCSFLHKFLPKINICGVDVDKDMLKVAVDWFNFKEDDKLKAEIQDGLVYIREMAKNGKTLDALLFDVDSKNHAIGMSCPPQQFMTKETLKNVVKIVDDEGIFVVNVVLRDNQLRPGVLVNLKNHFKNVFSYKLQEDLNEIFICSNGSIETDKLKDASYELNSFFKKHGLIENGVDTDKFLHSLVAQSVFI